MIDISLLESLIDVLGPAAAIHHRTGHIDGRYGSRLVFSAPRNVYAASDGYIVLSGSANQVALRIFDAIGRPELRDDERFATCPQRVANVEVLDGIIEAWTSQRTVQECIDVFSAAGAACGPVYDVAQLVADEHVQERGSFVEVESPDGEGPVLQLQPAPRLSRTPGEVRHSGLRPGACTDEVLAELGYDAEVIAKLRHDGVIGTAPALAATGS